MIFIVFLDEWFPRLLNSRSHGRSDYVRSVRWMSLSFLRTIDQTCKLISIGQRAHIHSWSVGSVTWIKHKSLRFESMLNCMANHVSTCSFHYQLFNSFVVIATTTTTTTTTLKTTTTITTTTKTKRMTANSTRVFAIVVSGLGCKLSISCSLSIVSYFSYQLPVSY